MQLRRNNKLVEKSYIAVLYIVYTRGKKHNVISKLKRMTKKYQKEYRTVTAT